MNYTFKTFLAESVALQSINTSELVTTIEKELKRLGVQFKAIESKYQAVFGGSEIQFRIKNAVVDNQKLDYFGIQLQQDGTVTGDAASRRLDRKHLIRAHSLGRIGVSPVQDKELIKAVQLAVKEIKHSIDVELN